MMKFFKCNNNGLVIPVCPVFTDETSLQVTSHESKMCMQHFMTSGTLTI